jgi:hypothetical protein
MFLVTDGGGRHSGARRAAQRPSSSGRRRLLLGGGCVLLVIAWIVLVKAAIDFGRSARAGDGSAWIFLVIASLGAIACLFAGLVLGVRLLVALNVLSEVPRVAGGRRARR